MTLIDIYGDKDIIPAMTGWKKYLRGKTEIFCYLAEYESKTLTLGLPKQTHPLFEHPGEALRCSPGGLCARVHPRPPSPEQQMGTGAHLSHRNTWRQTGHVHHSGPELVHHPQRSCCGVTAFSSCS